MIWRRNVVLAIVLGSSIPIVATVVPWANNVLAFTAAVLVLFAILTFAFHVWWRVPARSAARRRAILSGQFRDASGAGPTVSTGIAADWGFAGRAATLVAFDDDTVIVYFYPRAGLVGSSKIHRVDEVVMLGTELKKELRELAHRFVPTRDFPLPRAGELTFYLIDADGTRSAGPLVSRAISAVDDPFGMAVRLATRLLTRVCVTLPTVVPEPVLELVTQDRVLRS